MKDETIYRMIHYPAVFGALTAFQIGVEKVMPMVFEGTEPSPLPVKLVASAGMCGLFGALEACEKYQLSDKYATWTGNTIRHLLQPSLKTELKKMQGKKVGDLEDFVNRLKVIQWKQLATPWKIEVGKYI